MLKMGEKPINKFSKTGHDIFWHYCANEPKEMLLNNHLEGQTKLCAGAGG